MTTQDVFPKTGGDPLYYTEANRFAAIYPLFGGSTATVGSATAYQDVGSILISGGTLGRSAVFDVTFNSYSGTNAAIVPRFFVSGEGNNGGIEIDNESFNNRIFGVSKIMLARGISGIGYIKFNVVEGDTVDGGPGDSTEINPISPGSSMVFFYQLKGSGVNMGYQSLQITASTIF